METNTPARVGWVRDAAGTWRPVCSAETEDQCWGLLLDYRAPGVRERMVLPEGERPRTLAGF